MHHLATERHASLQQCLQDCSEKLAIIDGTIKREIAKQDSERHWQLVLFLQSERNAYGLVGDYLNRIAREVGAAPLEMELLAFDSAVGTAPAGAPALRRTYHCAVTGGIGDALLATASFRALKQRDPRCRVHVYCTAAQHHEVLLGNPNIDRLRLVERWKRRVYPLLNDRSRRRPVTRPAQLLLLNYGRLRPSLLNRHAAHCIGDIIGVAVADPRPDIYLSEAEAEFGRLAVAGYPNPIAVHPVSSLPNKDWPSARWEQLIANHPEWTFLQLGTHKEPLLTGAVDLRNTSLRNAFAIIAAARAFIGAESVFAHAAAALRTPAVVLFGPTAPAVWGYEQHRNVFRPSPCAPCMATLGRDPCPYDRSCMSNISVAEVQQALAMFIATERHEPQHRLSPPAPAAGANPGCHT